VLKVNSLIYFVYMIVGILEYVFFYI